MPRCSICAGDLHKVFTKTILHRYEVDYLECSRCEFLTTESPYWLSEAYSEAIVAADTGIATRNLSLHRRLAPTLPLLFGRDACYVDWAGGYGLLVRLMRDYGLDFYWQDRYCDNALARGFEWSGATHTRSAAVTAFEALEHAPAPVDFVEECLRGAGTDTFIFSQFLRDGLDTDWWYLAPEFGQHISFFTRTTLAALADRLGMSLAGRGDLFVLSKSARVSSRFVPIARAWRLTYPLVRRRLRSKVELDRDAVVETVRRQNSGR